VKGGFGVPELCGSATVPGSRHQSVEAHDACATAAGAQRARH